MSHPVVPPEGRGEQPRLVLPAAAVLEVLAYLVTSARTQVDEAAEYGPLRLLTAAHRLAERMSPRCSGATAAFVAGPLDQVPELAVPRTQREQYVARLDALCEALAGLLTERWAHAQQGPA
jgi:hypothetical protein